MKQKLWILIPMIILIMVFGCAGALAADSGQLNGNISWTLSDTGVLTISGRGAMPDYGNGVNESPFLDNEQITSVIIANSITAVGDRTFAGAVNLAAVTFPEGLESIGYGAFVRTGLTEVTIPASVTGTGGIGDIAFYGCSNLSRVTIMSPALSIYEETFLDCSPNLVLVGWKGSPVEDCALEYNIAFESLDVFERMIVLPNDLTTISSEAFENTNALYVLIPPTVTSIDGNPFAGSNILIVYGGSGTAAESFAQTYGYKFIALDSSSNR